ncbi:hypothetical protein RR46_02167 [Papilio xuthus]|uniref:Uncharacterized protein n=1 Tax=Papilio xuthus TaxID=66420 RepID=A0A194QPX1_PAPXU|nr:hypothetical protein RR46_02167 [Papilio xuthus]
MKYLVVLVLCLALTSAMPFLRVGAEFGRSLGGVGGRHHRLHSHIFKRSADEKFYKSEDKDKLNAEPAPSAVWRLTSYIYGKLLRHNNDGKGQDHTPQSD